MTPKTPQDHVRHWRNIPEATLEALEDFFLWYKYDHETDEGDEAIIKAQVDEMRRLIDSYLEYSEDQIKAGEADMLNEWIKATV